MARSAKSEESDKIDEIADKFALIHGAPQSRQRPRGSITAAEYAKYAGISHKTAGDWLLNLCREGKATRIKVGRTYCYSLNE